MKKLAIDKALTTEELLTSDLVEILRYKLEDWTDAICLVQDFTTLLHVKASQDKLPSWLENEGTCDFDMAVIKLNSIIQKGMKTWYDEAGNFNTSKHWIKFCRGVMKLRHSLIGTASDCEARHDSTYIDSIETYNSGGHCMIDIIKMHSGVVLTLTDENLIAWPKGADYLGDDAGRSVTIELPLD